MKQIIEGRMYNTETATEIANIHSINNSFTDYDESLYKKKNGEFFLSGWGGPLSHYARRSGDNEVSGSERIEPLTENEAMEWLEDHRFVDEYIELFGEPEE